MDSEGRTRALAAWLPTQEESESEVECDPQGFLSRVTGRTGTEDKIRNSVLDMLIFRCLATQMDLLGEQLDNRVWSLGKRSGWRWELGNLPWQTFQTTRLTAAHLGLGRVGAEEEMFQKPRADPWASSMQRQGLETWRKGHCRGQTPDLF